MIFEKDNHLLIATSNGLFRYQDGQFRKILDFKFNGQRNFAKDSRGDVWIGSDFGLIRISSQKLFCLNQEGFFEISLDGTVHNILQLEKANDYRVNSVREIQFPVYNIAFGADQRVWMITDFQDKNLITFKLSELEKSSPEWKFYRMPTLSFRDVSGISEFRNSVYFSSSNANIMLARLTVNSGKWENINLKKQGGDNVQLNIVQTDDRSLWIGGHSKLYQLTGSGWKVYQYPEVILPLSYISLYADENNNLFVHGTGGNLMKLNLSDQNISTYLGLNFHCNSADGTYWFTTNSGEVVSSDPKLRQWLKYNTADGLMDMAMSAFYSKESGLWISGSHHGKAAIARLNGSSWELKVFPDLYLGIAYNGVCELGDSAVAFPVNGILELDNTDYHGGFVMYNLKRKEWQTYSMDRVPQRIPSMGQTPDGTLWFSGNYFSVFKDRKLHRIDLPTKSSNWVDDVKVSKSGHVWVAQGGTGLFYNPGKSWQRFTTFHGLASNMVTNIFLENDSSVYVATDKGISFFDGKQFQKQIISPEITIQRERGHLRKSADGALWVNQGTREWYLYDFKNSDENPSVFKTFKFQKDRNAPKTSLDYSSQEMASSGKVIISYSAVDYWDQTASSKLQYSWRLNSGEWTLFTEQSSTGLLDLAPGDYTFQVRSRDLDGNVETQPVHLTFSILAPVYLRTWFLLTIFAFLGTIIWLLIRLYARNRQIHHLDQMKLRLFTDISHELKTPLTLISLPLQKLMSQSEKQDENRGSLELIQTNVQRLTNLVNQVVDFRRLEAGKIQLEISTGDLVSHLRTISNYYYPLAREKNIRYEFYCNQAECWVQYDADKLEKIVANLLSNAFKYTPENEKVELKVEISWDAGQLQLSVSDSGPGIPKEMQNNIFDRFYRLRNEKLNRIPGSGIGLSLVKELINLHGGSIQVISDGVHGSSFEVVLPLHPAERMPEPPVQAAPVTDLSKFHSLGKYSVLLIEDEEPMLRFVTDELANYFQIKGVGSVEKAFEWLQNEMPDLIISDLMLPGMSGLDFCAKLKSDPLSSHLPVILLTARDSESDIVEGLQSGADDYITKPFLINQLIARSFNLIENRKRFKARFADEELLSGTSFTRNQADSDYLDKAFRVVSENLDNSEFDVSQFCHQMNSSKTLLYSKLKSLTGQSATEFVRNIRLKEARKLLQNSGNQFTVSEISYQVGFNDPLYFSRCFRKYFGIPPSEIRLNKSSDTG